MQLAVHSLCRDLIHPGCLSHASRLAAVACCSNAPARLAAPAVRAISSAPYPTLGAWQQSSSRGVVSFAPSSFEYAISEMRRGAQLGTGAGTWPGPDRTRVMLEKVNELMGGRWVLIECGTFRGNHPWAGKPARALVHVALGYMTPAAADKTKAAKKLGKKTSSQVDIHLVKEPTPLAELPPGSSPLLYYAPYELDAHGLLTGRMHNSATGLEVQTNKHLQKKPRTTFKLVWDGQVQESLEKWRENRLGVEPYRVDRLHPRWRHAVSKWYKDMIEPAGVEVMVELNAAELAEQLAGEKLLKVDPAKQAVRPEP